MKLKTTGKSAIKWAPQALRPLVSCILSPVSYKKDGEIPRELIDDNLKTDVSWIERLTTVEENTQAMMDALVFDNQLEYDLKQLISKFNMRQFFEKDYYPVSLFYLGMVTCKDDFTMSLPNNTLREIFVDYYNELNNYEVSKGYTQYFRQYLEDQDIE